MIYKPDDQVLEYFIYLGKTARASRDVEKFQSGYQFWLSKRRR